MKHLDIRRMFARRRLESAALLIVALTGAGTIAARGPLMDRDSSKPMTQILARRAPVSLPGELETAPSNASWDLPNLDHKLVDTWVARMSGAQKSSLAMYMSRMQQHDSMIVRKAAARGVPTDLRFLALIESGGLPTAQSPVKARGLWQFMRGTAKDYGLRVDGGRDERIDPARSTDAALDYLSDLQVRFGSWYLAAAAYNAGEGRVGRVLQQVTGKKRGTDSDFFRIAHRLPAETRNYVPKLIAVARIAKEPARYGFTAEDMAAGQRALERLAARQASERAVAKRVAARSSAKAKVKKSTKARALAKAKAKSKSVAKTKSRVASRSTVKSRSTRPATVRPKSARSAKGATPSKRRTATVRKTARRA